MRTKNLKEWIGKNDDDWPPPQWVYRRKFELAGECCQGPCGRKLSAADKWHLDHIKRVRDGGENRESNLQVLCEWCHGEKTAGENKAGAKANRNFARHHGYKKPRSIRVKRDGRWKFDWTLRRYFRVGD